jgi:hypothetical protein
VGECVRSGMQRGQRQSQNDAGTRTEAHDLNNFV